jgi:hypothetical protein
MLSLPTAVADIERVGNEETEKGTERGREERERGERKARGKLNGKDNGLFSLHLSSLGYADSLFDA